MAKTSTIKARPMPRLRKIILESRNRSKASTYKEQLLEINDLEKRYDDLFDKKLSSQYREFRNMKEHNLQAKKFLRIFMILLTIILLALLLLSFSMQ